MAVNASRNRRVSSLLAYHMHQADIYSYSHNPSHGPPAHQPNIQRPHVLEAVLWALEKEDISA